jgi:hypothetical protein
MAKKKIKKLLKGLGIGAALLGAGKALMNRRDKANQMKEFLATEGGDLSDMRDYGPFSKGRGFVPVNMMTPQDMANDEMFMGAMAKKGGRIKKTKKGGRAVRKANRSKKK